MLRKLEIEDDLNSFFKWKTTSICLEPQFCLNMKDNLNYLSNGRQPQFILGMEDNLKFLVNERKPQFF